MPRYISYSVMVFFFIHFSEKHQLQEILDFGGKNANLPEGKEVLLKAHTNT